MRKIIVSFLALLLTVGIAQAYTVQSGDVLWKIAQEANLSLQELINRNPQIVNPNAIDVGQEINTGQGNMTLPFFQKLAGASSDLLGGNNINFVQVQNLYLFGSGISSTATSIVLTSFKYPNTDLVTMTDFGDIGYAVIEPDSPREENISFTGITQAATSATLTGVTRGLGLSFPYTASTTLRFAHSGSSLLRISNTAPFYNEFNIKGKDETITGKWTFNVFPQYISGIISPTTSSQFATKYYVDNVGAGGFTAGNIGDDLTIRARGTAPETMMVNTSTDGFFNLVGGLFTGNASTTGGITWNTGGIYVDKSDIFNWKNNHNFATTTHKNLISKGFGGTGDDGALSISAAATTTLDALNANVLVKNYTSITIPNTAGLALTNSSSTGTILVLKSQGDCTIGGNIWLRGNGATGITASTTAYALPNIDNLTFGRNAGSIPNLGVGGDRYTTSTLGMFTTYIDSIYNKSILIVPGSPGGKGRTGGGASGGTGATTVGAGGGAIILECGGQLNFTGSILIDGGNGTVGGAGGASSAGGGGSGGGSGGMAVILYNALTSNTGTIFARGGVGGDGGLGASGSGANSGAGGGGGACWSSNGHNGAIGDNSGAGNDGVSTNNACGAGGGSGSNSLGAVGTGGTQGASDVHHYYIGENTQF